MTKTLQLLPIGDPEKTFDPKKLNLTSEKNRGENTVLVVYYTYTIFSTGAE